MSGMIDFVWGIFGIVCVVFYVLINYEFWKDLRPDEEARVKGIPVQIIYDGVWFVLFAICLYNYQIIAFIICLVFLWRKMRNFQKKQIVSYRDQMISDEYEKLDQMNREVQFIRHDWKNHLLAIRTMIKEQNYEELESYLGEIEGSLYNSEMYVITGNRIVDAVLNKKTTYAREKKIDVQLQCDYLKGLKVADKDICVILANLYDNAIEAAEKVEENPWIHVDIVRNEDMLMVKFSNNYADKPKKMGGQFASVKGNRMVHGYGLLSVKRAVQKYDGDLDTDYDDEEFVSCVTIYDGFE